MDGRLLVPVLLLSMEGGRHKMCRTSKLCFSLLTAGLVFQIKGWHSVRGRHTVNIVHQPGGVYVDRRVVYSVCEGRSPTLRPLAPSTAR